MEYRSPLIFVDLYFLFGYDLLLSFLLWLFRFLVTVLTLESASQALVETVLILKVVDCFSSMFLLALDVVLVYNCGTHRSQWSQPIHLSSS